ncbi:MAG: DUF3616 domain-containing protein [Myxococcota bacterium]|nr:DUF3616 domain-containing protein [Myxococcota bacterium]
MPARNAKIVESAGWPEPARPTRQVTLQLDAPPRDEDDQPVQDVSAAAIVDRNLFVGSDEGAMLERLSYDGRGGWAHHTRFDLAELLELEHAGEVDVEGLAHDGGWLWVLGSHARTRPKVDDGDDDDVIDVEALAQLKDTRARCLLARIPLVRDDDGELVPVAKDGIRRAGKVKQTKRGSKLLDWLRDDPLLRPFTFIAAKEGGLDLEGIAVGGDRIVLGCRGPVIRSHTVLLEISVHATPRGRLKVERPPVKRLVDLDGLGVRDLERHGDDLLILAGPTTDLDGPVGVYRWRGWLHDAGSHDGRVRLHRPEKLLDLPFGRGDDHPEGLTVIAGDDDAGEVLVLVDGPSEARFDRKARRMLGDVFELPRT